MNIRDRASDGRTALMCCALVADERWGVGLARTLLERGARVGLRTYQLRLNALHFACMLGRAELVRTFLTALDFDLTAVDALGNTALHYAAAVGRLDIVRLITDVDFRYTGDGIKLLNCCNAAGLTAPDLAAKHGHVACVQLFNTLKKLHGDGVGGAAGDGRSSVHDTLAASTVPVTAAAEDAGGDAGGCGGASKSRRDEILVGVVKPPSAVVGDGTGDQVSAVLTPAVSLVVEKVKLAGKDTSAARTSGVVGTASTDIVVTQSTRRSKSTLPAARDANVGHPRSASDKAAALNTRRARSAVSQTSRSRGRLMPDSGRTGRTSCCFNLRRTACLCATGRGFAGDLSGVIENCVFSRAIVNAAPIAGPSPTERNKMERYQRCRSAAAAAVVVGSTTAVLCPRSAGRTPRRRRPAVSGVTQVTSADVDNTIRGHELNASAELISRLYRTYGYQFTTSYRHPAVQLLPSLPPPPASRLAGTEASDDDATTVSAVPPRARSSVTSRRGDRDRTSSRRSLKHTTSSQNRHH